MRASTLYLAFIVLCAAALAAIGFDAAHRIEAGRAQLKQKALLVARLGLTDLCLFPEARYTRNPAVADRHTPFQDGPLAFDHYPAGSLVPPPPHIGQGSAHHVVDRQTALPD